LNEEGTESFLEKMNKIYKEDDKEGLFISFHGDLFISERNNRYIINSKK
jgi:hypothetical protein